MSKGELLACRRSQDDEESAKKRHWKCSNAAGAAVSAAWGPVTRAAAYPSKTGTIPRWLTARLWISRQ